MLSSTNRRWILGIPFDNLTLRETVERIEDMMKKGHRDTRSRYVATANIDFIVNIFGWGFGKPKNPDLLRCLRVADLVTPDGMPIVWLSRLLNRSLKERVTGADLVPLLAQHSSKKKFSIFMLGGGPGVVQKAAEVLQQRYPGFVLAGHNSPMIQVEGQTLGQVRQQSETVIREINASGADLLLIALGTPKQELWFDRVRNQLTVPVCIGVGATFDFIAGTVSRAPCWMQKWGLEWFYRLTQEPSRLWKRYLMGGIQFLALIALSPLSNKRVA